MDDLNRLLLRLEDEAGLEIYFTEAESANITIQSLPLAEIQNVLPTAACFVAPNVSSLNEFRRKRYSAETSWSRQKIRQKVGVFLPSDVAPQEIRDCLHEEFAQALGPLNDLYHLQQSVFNDDNVHTVLTSFDMLILRITYAPELRSGMTRTKVASKLGKIVSRLNPSGDAIQPQYIQPTNQLWKNEILKMSAIHASREARLNAAQRVFSIAERAGWTDHRYGISLYKLARAVQPYSVDTAHDLFQRAEAIFARLPNTELHGGFVALQLAHHHIFKGDGEAALEALRPFLSTALQYENASLYATLRFLEAEALEMTGQAAEAQQVRLDSLSYARYGIGDEAEIRQVIRDINRLNPNN